LNESHDGKIESGSKATTVRKFQASSLNKTNIDIQKALCKLNRICSTEDAHQTVFPTGESVKLYVLPDAPFSCKMEAEGPGPYSL
jgi:hypothetical protein